MTAPNFITSSRTSYNAGRRLDTGGKGAKAFLTEAQAAMFIPLLAKIIGYAGTLHAACKLTGIASDATLTAVLNERKLTSGTAHKILATYKQIKHLL